MTDGLKSRALRLLAGREHSRAELARKLGGGTQDPSVAPLLDQLESLELLSDTRFAHSYVRARQGRIGNQRLRMELRERGVAVEDIEAAIASELETDEATRARAVWQRKFGSPPTDPREWARQARFLNGRGFSADVIHRILKDSDDEPA